MDNTEITIPHQSTSYDTLYQIVSYLPTRHFSVSTFIEYRNYTVEIASDFFHDSISSEEPNSFNPVPLNQSICFYRNDSLLSSFSHPVRRVFLKTENGAKVELLDNEIVGANLIHGSKHSLFVTCGYGGSNGGSEFYGYYTLDGELLGIDYRTGRFVHTHTVNGQEVMTHCGISPEDFVIY